MFACTFLVVSCHDIKTVSFETPQENTLQSGEDFDIRLPENHTTGYMWQLSNSYNSQQIDYINAVWHGNEKGIYFNFKTVNKGTTKLDFSLIKYKDTLDTKTFIINVQ